jgi:predicted O-linked N-acetylglucosamine transferase (SPINDLY family)
VKKTPPALARRLERAQALLAEGKHREAALAAEELLESPGGAALPTAWLLRGVCADRAGDASAEGFLEEAHRRGAEGAALQLGRHRLLRGKLAEAFAALDGAADPMARLVAAEVRFLQGAAGEAAARFSAELSRLPPGPLLVPFFSRLAQAEAVLGRHDRAAAAWRQVLVLEPGHDGARLGLARALTRANRPEEAIALLGPAPGLAARWADARAVPVVYRDEEELRRYRARYSERLSALAATPLDQAQARALLPGMECSFPTHYACEDDTALQRLHGGLVHRVVHTAHPEFDEPLAPAPRRERLRVGFVSSFFREHTVSRLFQGWIRGLDRRSFEVALYPLGPLDAWGRALLGAADRARPLSGDLAADVRLLRSEAPHALLYPELGMDMQTLRLAAVRCAPLQAVAWGHPVTTGLPNVDAFLTAEAMEPPHAEAHYSERLVRLPGLSLCIDAPPPVAVSRADLGIPEDRFLVFCTQAIFKLLPRNDHVFARLARRVPRALLVFVGTEGVPGADVFLARMERAFAQEGLRFQDHATLLPPVGHAAFLQLNRVADLFLDGLAWSGGMTTLEAVGCGLLPVCLEGPFMRMRHTAAILRTLGLGEQIAADGDDLVERVAALAGDRALLGQRRAALAAAAGVLWGDARPVRALEEWLRREAGAAVVRSPGPASPGKAG